MYDVAIVGCGVVGSAVAYALSQYKLSVLVLEKENDVATGATRANSAVLHAGFDPKPGTLMARLNVRGVELAKKLCEDLDVPREENGALVVSFYPEDDETIKTLYEQGIQNGVPGLRLLSKEETLEMEPNLDDSARGALYAPSSAIVNPWDYALAMAETAVRNGAELKLNAKVTGLQKSDNGYLISTQNGNYESRFLVTAGGVHCDELHDMLLPHDYTVIPTRGEYFLFDKSEGKTVSRTIFRTPNKKGKGVLVLPTVHGNLLVGPSADVASEADRVNTTAEGLDFVKSTALMSVPTLNFRSNIKNFAGMRANTDREDFIIRAPLPGFVEAAGIRSPGLSAAPAIAEEVVELLEGEGLCLEKKPDPITTRRKIRIKDLSIPQMREAIKKNPLYGRVICRCEMITEGEILDAIHSPIPPASVDAVKRRAGTGMGRCQSGFCGPRVLEILARETEKSPLEIPQDTVNSVLLTGITKEDEEDV